MENKHEHTEICDCRELEAELEVYLIGKTEIDVDSIREFFENENYTLFDSLPPWVTDVSDGPQMLTEFAGRVCYMSFGKAQGRKTNKAYLDNIIESKHGSVLEHVNFTFLITGVSRSLTHELVRHRAGFAFSQVSQRYVDEADCKFIRPAQITEDSDAYGLWINSCRYSRNSYRQVCKKLEAEVADSLPEESKRNKRILARQAARAVLPNCTETKIVVTCNARALRHFIEYRGGEGAEVEIRRLAVRLAWIAQREYPNLFGDYVIDTEKLTVTTQNEKV